MQKKSLVEMERQKVSKITRTLVRLKYSLRADEEINQLLPDTLKEFNSALQSGELKQLHASMDDILGEL